MQAATIKDVSAREILDSRGNPTIEVCGVRAIHVVDGSIASPGMHRAPCPHASGWQTWRMPGRGYVPLREHGIRR